MMEKSLGRLSVCAVILLMALTTIHTVASWKNYSTLDGTSGVWIALANDFSKGIFYRPIYGESGYGGTRYFPLCFVLQGLVARLGIGIITSGFITSFLSVALLLGAMVHVLRKNGLGTKESLIASIFVFSSTAVLLALTTIRGDALPLAFSLWGMALIDEEKPKGAQLGWASLLFSLAFAAKITAVTGLLAAVCALAACRKYRQAAGLLLLSGIGYATVLGAMYVGSGGRVFDIFRVCSSGGAALSDILKGPKKLLVIMSYNDMGALVSFVLGLACAFRFYFENLHRKWTLFFFFALGMTIFIYGSPGTNYNQLIDLHVASILLCASMYYLAKNGKREFHVATVISALFIVSLWIMSYLTYTSFLPLRKEYREIVETIGRPGVRLLSENPMIPILAGENPYIIDSFMLRLIRKGDPEVAKPLMQKLRDKQFDYILLYSADPRDEKGRRRLENDIFGEGFLPELEARYRLWKVVGRQLIYAPIKEGDS